MHAEYKETIKPSEITFLTKKILIYLQPSIQRTFPINDVTHITERRMSVSSADTITQTFLILHCSRFVLKHSGTFLIAPRWFLFYIQNFCLQYSARLFNDILLYRKPSYHHSCWVTQRCQMYQAQEKPFESFSLTKEQQMASQSLSQRCGLERPHSLLAEWEQKLRQE